jgi:hypothetical protein
MPKPKETNFVAEQASPDSFVDFIAQIVFDDTVATYTDSPEPIKII